MTAVTVGLMICMIWGRTRAGVIAASAAFTLWWTTLSVIFLLVLWFGSAALDGPAQPASYTNAILFLLEGVGLRVAAHLARQIVSRRQVPIPA